MVHPACRDVYGSRQISQNLPQSRLTRHRIHAIVLGPLRLFGAWARGRHVRRRPLPALAVGRAPAPPVVEPVDLGAIGSDDGVERDREAQDVDHLGNRPHVGGVRHLEPLPDLGKRATGPGPVLLRRLTHQLVLEHDGLPPHLILRRIPRCGCRRRLLRCRRRRHGRHSLGGSSAIGRGTLLGGLVALGGLHLVFRARLLALPPAARHAGGLLVPLS
mmetsp:Transcript_20300/g.68663  ORF Transcript_20300/g.68663 Transcript_20300/m.68663 type:complete len:217 (+) Transcript_20300:92-742(+)